MKVEPAGEPCAVKGVISNIQQYNPVSRLQVKLRTNARFKMIVGCTTIMAVFVDVLGSALVMPVIGPLCSWAENGPADSIMAMDMPLTGKLAMIEEIIQPDAFKDPKPPFKFSLAINVPLSIGMVGSALGSLVFGWMCDKVGCKLPMQICVFNGIIGYIIIYASGKWYNSYYLFSFGLFWNNFFGNTMGVASVYMRTLFEEGPQRDAFVGSVLGMGLLGGSVGALIVMPFVTSPKNGANYFNAVWLAIGLTVAMFLAVTFVLVPAPKPTEEEIQKQKEKENEKTPDMALKILITGIIGSGLDSAGDEGTRMARGTIMSTVFPEWSTTERQNYLLLAIIAVIMAALVLLGFMRKCLNLGGVCVLGCVFTLATQLLLMIEWDAAPYIAIWHAGKLFGFVSTIGSSFLIQETAPKNLLGRWNSRNEAVSNICMGIAPLIFATIYDGVGNPRGQEMLAATSAISFLSVIAYVPIIGWIPKPKKKEDEDQIQDMSVYDAMSDVEFGHLPMEVLDKVCQSALEKGNPPRLVSWGDYKKERALLTGLQQRATKDFEYFNQAMITTLTNRELMAQEQENFKKLKDLMPKVDRDKAREEMGTWIADYFDDAGYEGWETQCTMYKSMVLNAFPPIDPLDDLKPDYTTMPLDKFEENMLTFLGILDQHIVTNKTRVRPGFSANTLLGLIRRR